MSLLRKSMTHTMADLSTGGAILQEKAGIGGREFRRKISECINLVSSIGYDPSLSLSLSLSLALNKGSTMLSLNHVSRLGNESTQIRAHSAEQFVSSVFRNFTPECIRHSL
jgi:hypothetical protein